MEFAERTTEATQGDKEPPLYTNLWMRTSNLQEARTKYDALPKQHTFGLAWSQKDYAVRVSASAAEELAPLVTGRAYTNGDKYEIHGVPRDWQPAELFEAMATTDNPWPRICEAQLLSKRPAQGAFRWRIKAPMQPTTTVTFLDEYVLTIKKA